MSSTEIDRLRADIAGAEADVLRLRTENAALAEEFRAEPTDAMREILKRAAASLSAARDRVLVAKAALEVFEKTGSTHGVVAAEGAAVGSIAVTVAPGASRKDRERAIHDAVTEALTKAAGELGVTLAASPERYTRERPGRDAEGRTVLDVTGRVEGDVLVPAVTRPKLRSS